MPDLEERLTVQTIGISTVRHPGRVTSLMLYCARECQPGGGYGAQTGIERWVYRADNGGANHPAKVIDRVRNAAKCLACSDIQVPDARN